MDHLLRSPAHTTLDCRETVFRAAGGVEGVDVGELAGFVEQVANASYRITDEVVQDLSRSRSENELFEIILVAAAGAASARRAAALHAWHGR